MRRPVVLSVALSLTFCITALAPAFARAQQPSAAEPSATQMMTDAQTRATSAHKNIIVIFSASWCGPCHQLERFFADSKVAPILDPSFVRVKFNVGEHREDSRHPDTPGGADLKTSLGGDNTGVPFFVITDAAGKPIVDSQLPGKTKKENIGYPSTIPDIEWFLQMLQKTAPSLTPKQIKALRNSVLDQTER